MTRRPMIILMALALVAGAILSTASAGPRQRRSRAGTFNALKACVQQKGTCEQACPTFFGLFRDHHCLAVCEAQYESCVKGAFSR